MEAMLVMAVMAQDTLTLLPTTSRKAAILGHSATIRELPTTSRTAVILGHSATIRELSTTLKIAAILGHSATIKKRESDSWSMASTLSDTSGTEAANPRKSRN